MTATVLLVGRPNAGKSSIFNRITGHGAHVGNFPGITVDVLELETRTPRGETIRIIDLPGVYSLDARLSEGTDESITRTFLANEKSERLVIAQVVDARQLGLGLRLTKELVAASPNARLLLVVTQRDLLERDGARVDEPTLARETGARVVAVSAREEAAKQVVLDAIDELLVAEPKPASAFSPEEAAKRSVTTKTDLARVTLRARTERIDAVLLHPVLGPLLFLVIMSTLFASVFFIADPVTSLCDDGVQGLGQFLRPRLGGGLFASAVVDGALGGAGTVAAFLPQIMILVAGMELLESTGYLARAAYLVDRLFRSVGIGGKAFVPLMTGHACAVPAISATRVLRDPKERLTTILVIPLMACSARLPVYSLVVTTFFGGSAFRKSMIFLGLFLFGILSGLVVAAVLRRTVTRGRGLPLALEMPDYRAPLPRAIVARVTREAREFIVLVGRTIVIVSLVLWGLLNVPVGAPTSPDEPPIERSVAATVGRAVEPITRPLGFDWRINVGLVGSFGAREVMVGTLGVIFGIERADEDAAPLSEKIAAARRPDGTKLYTTATAISLLVFFVFACQCMSTLSAVRRETKSWRWTGFVLGYTYALAYVLAAVAFQVTRALGG